MQKEPRQLSGDPLSAIFHFDAFQLTVMDRSLLAAAGGGGRFQAKKLWHQLITPICSAPGNRKSTYVLNRSST